MKHTSRNDENIKVFNDTIKQIESSNTLLESVMHSIALQEFISDSVKLDDLKPVCNTKKGTVKVSTKSTLDAARSYSGKVCVHNFASATNPGGGVERGSSAQEECLCRCSTLFKCLTASMPLEKFYGPHRADKTTGVIHNDDILYTPRVHVIKSDSYTNLYRNAVVDVITCAAPNLRETPANAYNHEAGEGIKLSDTELYEIHLKRAKKIMAVAAHHNVDVLVLGAFGCGAFRNNPEIVANAYKDALKDYATCFDTVEFAVFCRADKTENYDAFNRIIGTNA